ncbi:MAG: hypothetical protein H6705_04275 [Myxococcales bacterium]|nr:hypothetical protein [Myxococcales bacterium]
MPGVFVELVFVDSRGLGPVDATPRVVATLAVEAAALVERGLPPFEVMSGFGAAFFLAFRFGGARGFLEQRMAADEGAGTMVAVQGEADDTALLRAVLEAAGLDLDDCVSVGEGVDRAALPRWVLWRQDDNGDRFVVETFTGRRKADDRAARMEAGGHKQLYWVASA